VLELRPNCEACDRDLPPDSLDARICTYECTFCADCVATLLHDVCPNCGGGFERRPVRPVTQRRPGTSLVHDAASTERRHLRWEREEVARFAAELRDVPPAAR